MRLRDFIGPAAFAITAVWQGAAAAFDYGPLLRERTPKHVGAIMEQVARDGRGDHRFTLTYCTAAPGVVLPQRIREAYPSEITIVLEWEFWNLQRIENEIHVMVGFGGIRERIVIPLEALTHFADPSVEVAVWFRTGDTSDARCAGMADTA